MKNHNTQFVNVLDLQTKVVNTIPVSELAPGMIEAYFENLGGKFWIDPSRLGDNQKGIPFRHPPFDKQMRGRLRKIRGVLAEVLPKTLEELESDFRRDAHPQREIDLWLKIAQIYQSLAGDLSFSQKHELFQVLVQCSCCPYDHVYEVISIKALGMETATKTIEQFYGQPILKKQLATVPVVEYPDAAGSIPHRIEDLSKKEEREALKSASIVFAVDFVSGKSDLLYGQEALESIVRAGESGRLHTISYLYDSRTDQLDQLVRAVLVLKGSCCFLAENGG